MHCVSALNGKYVVDWRKRMRIGNGVLLKNKEFTWENFLAKSRA